MVSETLASWKIVKNGVIGIGMKFFAQWNFHALSLRVVGMMFSSHLSLVSD